MDKIIFIASIFGVLILVVTHLFVDKLNLTFIPRSKWLSTAGGVSVAYIFVHVLPELQKWQVLISKNISFKSMPFLVEHHVYIFSLLGLTIFYGLERAAKISKQSHRSTSLPKMHERIGIFWIHMFSFSVYNILIGYLLLNREQNNIKSLLFFVIAMAFHFLVNDYGLLQHYRETYKKKGKWIISASIIIGWLCGILIEIPDIYIGIIFAFIAGGVIMNVLKEELPEERKSNYWAFLLGIILYSIFLLLL